MSQWLECNPLLDGFILSRTRFKVDVVIQIGYMPLESRCIGDYSKLVFIELRDPTDNFHNHHTSVRLSNSPMHRTYLVIERDDIDSAYGCLYLINC